MVYQLVHIAAQYLVAREAEQPGAGAVQKSAPTLGIDAIDPFGGGLQQRFKRYEIRCCIGHKG
jgi:hypothetical protein